MCAQMDNLMPWPDNDDLLTASKLATCAGVSATTIRNWIDREDGLPIRKVHDKPLIRWSDLVSFVGTHPELPAAAALSLRIRAPAGESAGAVAGELATLRAIAQDARAAAAAASDAALHTAEMHMQTVRSLRTAIAALDSALAMALADDTLND